MSKNDCLENRTVYVENEFAPLKRAILSQSEYIITQENGSRTTDRNLMLLFMQRERDSLKALLESYGVEVLMPRKLNEHEKETALLPEGLTGGAGMTNFFSRDPIFVVGNNIIELNMKDKQRRCEVFAMRDILTAESAKGDCKYLSMPRINNFDETGTPFLEGGDILLLGKTVYVGVSDHATNEYGYEWLKSYLSAFGYEVKAVRVQADYFHLDCVMSFVREGLMIVCEDYLPDGIPEEFASWDKIFVPSEMADRLAVNGLPLNEEVYLTDMAFRNTLGKELEKRGVRTEYLDFRFTRTHKGAFRCSVNPLLREY